MADPSQSRNPARGRSSPSPTLTSSPTVPSPQPPNQAQRSAVESGLLDRYFHDPSRARAGQWTLTSESDPSTTNYPNYSIRYPLDPASDHNPFLVDPTPSPPEYQPPNLPFGHTPGDPLAASYGLYNYFHDPPVLSSVPAYLTAHPPSSARPLGYNLRPSITRLGGIRRDSHPVLQRRTGGPNLEVPADTDANQPRSQSLFRHPEGHYSTFDLLNNLMTGPGLSQPGLTAPPLAGQADARSSALPTTAIQGSVSPTSTSGSNSPLIPALPKVKSASINQPLFVMSSDPGPFLIPSYLRGSRFLRKMYHSYSTCYPEIKLPPLSQLNFRIPRPSSSVCYSDEETDREVDSLENSASSLDSIGDEGLNIPTLLSGTRLNRDAPSAKLRQYSPTFSNPPHRSLSHKAPRSDIPLVLLPTQINESDRSANVDISYDKAAANISSAPGLNSTSDSGTVLLRSNNPIPPECGIYFFEVSIAVNGTESVPHVGFTDSSTLPNTVPGSSQYSVGYNCATGNISSSALKITHTDKCQFDVLTVGMGFVFRTGKVFLTLESSKKTEFQSDIITKYRVFPAVGIQRPNGARVKFNFGQSPFRFDIDSFIREEQKLLRKRIMASPIPMERIKTTESEIIRSLVLQHLLTSGYAETAKSMADEIRQDARLDLTGEVKSAIDTYEKNCANASIRKQIIELILDGQIQESISRMEILFPSFLEERKSLHFRLKCRLFIEAVYAAHSKTTNGTLLTNGNSDHSASAQTNGNTEQFEMLILMGQKLRSDPILEDDNKCVELLTQTLGIMAYPSPLESPLSALFNPLARRELAEELNREILAMLGQNRHSGLDMIMRHTDALVSILDIYGKGGVAIDEALSLRRASKKKAFRQVHFSEPLNI